MISNIKKMVSVALVCTLVALVSTVSVLASVPAENGPRVFTISTTEVNVVHTEQELRQIINLIPAGRGVVLDIAEGFSLGSSVVTPTGTMITITTTNPNGVALAVDGPFRHFIVEGSILLYVLRVALQRLKLSAKCAIIILYGGVSL